MAKFATIEDYLAAQAEPHREIGEKVLPMIDKALPKANKAVWHGHPVWSLGAAAGKSPVCLLKAYPAYLTFGFWRGQLINDKSGRLESGSGEMAHVKLRAVSEIDTKLFADWLKQARELELPHLS